MEKTRRPGCERLGWTVTGGREEPRGAHDGLLGQIEQRWELRQACVRDEKSGLPSV